MDGRKPQVIPVRYCRATFPFSQQQYDTMPRIDEALSGTDDGVILLLEVSAGSRQDSFPAGFNPWRKTILCRVTAPPLEGRANAAVLSLIAEVLDLPVTSLRIRSGATSTLKKVLITGLPKQALTRRIESLMQEQD